MENRKVAQANIGAAEREAWRLCRLVQGAPPDVASQLASANCDTERNVLNLAIGVRDAAANTLAFAEAGVTAAQMALMECEANNG